MSRVLARRKSPLGDDVRIVAGGVWGFVLQCLKSWLTPREEPDDAR